MVFKKLHLKVKDAKSLMLLENNLMITKEVYKREISDCITKFRINEGKPQIKIETGD
jgi:hypothetical protein